MVARLPALLLIGMQNDHFPGGLAPLEGIEAVAPKAAALLAQFRENDWPRFHVQHVSIRPGANHCVAGCCGVEFHDSLAPLPDEPVIVKHVANCFRDTTLHDDLWERDVGELVVAGACTHLCVDAAVRHAVDFGFACNVIEDACIARSVSHGGRTVSATDVHAAHLATLAGSYARVLSLEAWLARRHPEALAA
ncbi:cysteine hydrolase family protein [Usitatibacter palustris]|uniref:Isochorismatase-like domain-containing protein n=1 Tax=Usitatibacter palustris TaxID=2732487 RepID=A0A6M4H629_9PROT|nr:cysteine hydrolase family protein [Usitatibacter palustris]QJR14113.1 hypothetical protein DSM104440_00906 [Usitatibacter palustris]